MWLVSGCADTWDSDLVRRTPARPGVSGEPAPAPNCEPGQSVLASEVVNARDLGGIALADGRHVACGALYRGAPLAPLSEQGCAEFASLSVRTLIDLRQPEERDAKPDAPCAVDTVQQVLAPLPIPYNVSPQDYLADLDSTASMASALNALADDAAYPAYFHCTYGRDRTGVFAAVLLLTLGVDRASILEEYSRSSEAVGAYPLSLSYVLDQIDARGGIDAYLAAANVSPDAVATLRRRGIQR